jgi:chemotaxis protein histidine kinase CheA
MSIATFRDRLDRVRQRFVATLDSKIEDVYAAMAHLPEATPEAAASVEKTYHSVHTIVGLGSTVGFPATGHAAREVEDVLRAPRQKKRGLTADEINLLKKRLHSLREAASRELEFFYSI